MIILLNGAFGIGKTTVARQLVTLIPQSTVFDPELAGIGLQRLARVAGQNVGDFQDLRIWRRLTIGGLRAARWRWANIVVPMAVSNQSYLDELRRGISRFEPKVRHYCLVAPTSVVHARLRNRGADPVRNEWEFRRAAECCDAHTNEAFIEHVDASTRTPNDIATELAMYVNRV